MRDIESLENKWRFQQSPYLNMAERAAKGQDTTVYLDDDGLEIELDSGSGYMRQTMTGYVHMGTLIKLFTHMGWKVTNDRS